VSLLDPRGCRGLGNVEAWRTSTTLVQLKQTNEPEGHQLDSTRCRSGNQSLTGQPSTSTMAWVGIGHMRPQVTDRARGRAWHLFLACWARALMSRSFMSGDCPPDGRAAMNRHRAPSPRLASPPPSPRAAVALAGAPPTATWTRARPPARRTPRRVLHARQLR